MPRTWLRRTLAIVLGVVVLAVVAVAIFVPNAFELFFKGDDRDLREERETPAKPEEPTALVIAIDGVDRKLLYDMLRNGELPELGALLGGAGGKFPHAYFDQTALAPLPTSTLASWATIFTGEPPAKHGVTGNEYFIRSERRFVAPAPVSIDAPDLVFKTYTDDYANKLLGVPTLYEKLRAKKPQFSAWVAMSQFFRGADRLIVADRTVVGEAFTTFLDDDDDADDLELYAALDRKVVENVAQALEKHAPPHVLTVYLTGADHFAHSSEEGPDRARRRYLREVFEPLMATLRKALVKRDALSSRYVVVVSDHGHTAVRHDKKNALAIDKDDDPPAVVRATGFRLRAFELEDDDPFDTVLAYGGALAYVYVADRSTCATTCDWKKPARFEEDVVPLAEGFHAANARGAHAPSMRGSLDLVLVRSTGGELLEYVGNGRTRPLQPHASYLALRERLRDLTVGDRGDHAGDIVLIARNGAEPDIANRYYFSKRYYSWHGSPSPADSEIPFILAHPKHSTAELSGLVRRVAGDTTEATDITSVIVRLLAP
jgi:hypothetical protein